VPLGAHAVLEGGTLTLSGFVAHPDGSRFLHAMTSGGADDPEALGQALAEQLLGQGARAILDALPAA
jgi:hydroxymethylbilane synthase